MERKRACDSRRCEQEICAEGDCKPSNCPVLPHTELVCKWQSSVVEIHSEFILLGPSGGVTPPAAVTGGTPLAANGRADVLLEGNGFFIKGHYIICPASLVLMPPSLTSVALRYPYANTSVVLPSGVYQDTMTRASRILVSVFNVNGKGHSFVYEADLVGVDGAGDIAVLKINYKKPWNSCNPCLERCHPWLTLGKSRSAQDGESVFLLGDFVSRPNTTRLFNAVGAAVAGVVADHRYIDFSGWCLAELVLVAAGDYSFSAGMPILDGQGRVIAMQTTDLAGLVPSGIILGASGLAPSPAPASGAGMVAGPSEFFMRRVIKTLIKGTCAREYNAQLETVRDAVGSYYRYKKAYLGLGYTVWTGANYDITRDYTSGTATSNVPKIRLSTTGEFEHHPTCKQLVGLRVLTVAGNNTGAAASTVDGFYYIPGGTGSAGIYAGLTAYNQSPMLGRIFPGDIITHLHGLALGDLHKQVAPSLVTWRLCAGDQVDVCWRHGGDIGNTASNATGEHYENLQSYTFTLNDYPHFLDYPWYAVSIFPLLALTGYPAFVFPSGQGNDPQLPQPQYAVGATPSVLFQPPV